VRSEPATVSACGLQGFRRVRGVAVSGVVTGLAMAGCGWAPSVPRGAAPIGTGARYELTSLHAATAAGTPVGGLRCTAGRRPVAWAHVELFAAGRALLVPPGVGLAPPRERQGAYVRGGRCRYPVWTDEPTGLVAVTQRGRTLGDLFAVWGRRLGRDRMAGFGGRVLAHVGGRRWTGDPAAIPLRHHAQIVLQVGGARVPPHARYVFPEGR
jgi:hypothetical protein